MSNALPGVIAAAGASIPIWEQYNAALFIDAAQDELDGASAPILRWNGGQETLTLAGGSAVGHRAASASLGGIAYKGDGSRFWGASSQAPGLLDPLTDGTQDWTIVAFAQGPAAVEKRIFGSALSSAGLIVATTSTRYYFGYFRDDAGNIIDVRRSIYVWNAGVVRSIRYDYTASTDTVQHYFDGSTGDSDTNVLTGSFVAAAPTQNLYFMGRYDGTFIWDADVAHLSIWPGKIATNPALKAALEAYLTANWTNFSGSI